MIVQIDVDGVLADFRRAWADLVYQRYGIEVPLNETSWDELFAPTGGPGGEVTKALWNNIKQREDFWLRIPSLLTDSEVSQLREVLRDHSVYFVTARPGKYAKRGTELWLDTWFDWPTVIISSRKADAANALNANYTIDDKPGNVLATYYQSPPDRKIYIRDHPFNQFDHQVAGRRIRRVRTLGEFLTDVQEGR